MEPLPKAAKFTFVQNLFVFGTARLIAWTVLKLFGRATIKGAEQFPRHGGVLILANHLSDCDVLMVQLSCPRNVHFMAKGELFDIPILRNAMRWGGTFPIKRGEPDRAALRHSADLLRLGEVLCIFPEGQLSEDGKLQDIKPGIATIIRMAEPTVICLGLNNTQFVVPYSKFTPRFSRRQVWSQWGKPRKFEGKADSKEVVEWVEDQLRSLTDQPPRSQPTTVTVAEERPPA